MNSKRFQSGWILMALAIGLAGCGAQENQSKNTAEAPRESSDTPLDTAPTDPLTEARLKLFNEIGIDEKNLQPKKEEGAPLPTVLPTPPELPKTDADLK